MVLVQKWPFFQLFFLGNIGQENVFYDILERKNVLCKGQKLGIFQRGQTMVSVKKKKQDFFLV